MMTMQPSLTTMKTVTAYDQSLHLRDIERSRARVARERTQQGARKKVRTLRFPRPSRLHRALARSLTTRNEEVAPSPLHIFW